MSDDQRETVEMAVTLARSIVETARPGTNRAQLAGAVIALDEECRRLRGEADRAADTTAERIAAWLDRCGGGMQSVARDIRDRSWRPVPSSPGASEANEADVEAVAMCLHAAVEKENRTWRRWDGMHETAQREYMTRAREAVRLGARVPR